MTKIKDKILSVILLTCSLYCYPSTQPNQLVTDNKTQRLDYNNSKTYLLFDNSGKGNMTKIYDSNTNEIKFIIPINDTMIQIIPR